MRIYEITAFVEPDLAERFERYMRDEHIPELLATEYFTAARFARDGNRFRSQYETDDLDGYLENDADRLRADFVRWFPSGVTVVRETWDLIQAWNDCPAR